LKRQFKLEATSAQVPHIPSSMQCRGFFLFVDMRTTMVEKSVILNKDT